VRDIVLSNVTLSGPPHAVGTAAAPAVVILIGPAVIVVTVNVVRTYTSRSVLST
jgi:hypothetical protein